MTNVNVNVENKIENGVYIPSIEGCDIWEHMNRNREIKSDYIGFLPYSLELRQLDNLILCQENRHRFSTALSLGGLHKKV
ncbi:hypothetical protein KHA94_13555 [Bacillus sp. FJAT-49705]|uniref:Uncharacterized protein n=1 Tax=Cytobacillus citreus TaxID=2833586 RepID=A0ABS5NWA0_9BACI|nr:hypothetical protein [Cytobacillus citreus]MBS4191209.1 hypothetical protein [Cytobacillus citreus]